MAGSGGSLDARFFIYDHTVLKKEEDDLKDAIIYFYPPTCDVESQCALCGQLMGMVGFFRRLTGSASSMYKLGKCKFAVKHVGKYSLALADDLNCPDSLVLKQLEKLYKVFSFYQGSLEMVYKTAGEDQDLFLSKMPEIWECYIPFITDYGDIMASLFDRISTVQLPKNSESVFLQASNVLEVCQRVPGVLAGCLLHKQSVLCTQISPEITMRLLLIRAQQSHLPCQRVRPDFPCPGGVRLLTVYITEQEYGAICINPFHVSVARHCKSSNFKLKEHFSSVDSTTSVSDYSQRTTPMSNYSEIGDTGNITPQDYIYSDSEFEASMVDDNTVTDKKLPLVSVANNVSNSFAPIPVQASDSALLQKWGKMQKSSSNDSLPRVSNKGKSLKNSRQDMYKKSKPKLPRAQSAGVIMDVHEDQKKGAYIPFGKSRRSSLEFVQSSRIRLNVAKPSIATGKSHNKEITENGIGNISVPVAKMQTDSTTLDNGGPSHICDSFNENNSLIENKGADNSQNVIDESKTAIEEIGRNKQNVKNINSINGVSVSDIENEIILHRDAEFKNETVVPCEDCQLQNRNCEADCSVSDKVLAVKTATTTTKEQNGAKITNGLTVPDISQDDYHCQLGANDAVSLEIVCDLESRQTINELQNNLFAKSQSDSTVLENGCISHHLNHGLENNLYTSHSSDGSSTKTLVENSSLDGRILLQTKNELRVKDGSSECENYLKPENRLDETDHAQQDVASDQNEQSSFFNEAPSEGIKSSGKVLLPKNVMPAALEKESDTDSEVDGMKSVSLYIQGNSDMVLLLLMEKGTCNNRHAIRSLWQNSIQQLADLDFQLRELSRQPSESNDILYSYLKYDKYQKGLTGNTLDPVSGLENEFCDIACAIHDDFEQHPLLRDVTLRSHTNGVYAHEGLSHETYVQLETSLPTKSSVMPLSSFDLSMSLDSSTKCALDIKHRNLWL